MPTRLLAVAAVGLLLPGAVAGSHERKQTTFRVAFSLRTFDSIDPILAEFLGSGVVLRAACASLLTHPPKRPPQGYRLLPDLATGQPQVSKDGKRYTFTIRRGRRFSTGRVVTPQDVAQTFNRALDRRLNSPVESPLAAVLSDIAGSDAVLAGRARRAKGIDVRGRKLVLRVTRGPAPEFLATAATLCVLPAGLPVDPEGLSAPFPTAGPYAIASYSPARSVVLRRNRFYTGRFPGRVDRVEATITDEGSIVDRVNRGEFDWGLVPNDTVATHARELARQHGINRSRFFVARGLFLRMLVLNTSRPLFRNNARLRRAVNFAIDRQALLRERGYLAGTLTDQYLSPSFPGFRDARVYPLKRGRVAEARRLARGHTRGKRAVFYASDRPADRTTAEIVRRNLARIGIDVEVKLWPGRVVFDKLATRGEPFDIARVGWLSPPDPALLNFLFDGRTIGKPGFGNFSYLDSPTYNRALARAAKLTGSARYRAYAELDLDLVRSAAPAVAYAYDNDLTLVGPRVPRRCVVVNYPNLDLLAACLKR